MTDSRCPRCTRGKLQLDNFENELVCVNCGYRQGVKATPKIKAVAKTQATDIKAPAPTPEPIRKIEKLPAPAKADTGRLPFLRLFRKEKTPAPPVPAQVAPPVEERRRWDFYKIPFSTFSTNGAWYEPNSIRLSKAQSLFLIKNLGMLSEGQYPPEPREYQTEIFDKDAKKHVEVTKLRSAYIKTGEGKINRRSHFETPAMITSELTSRMRHCGIDGMILLLLCCFDSEDKQWIGREIANFMEVDMRMVNKRAETALKFISGKWPKDRTYKQFRSHKKAV